MKTMSMAAKVPHFYYVDEINCDALVNLKACFQASNTDPGIKHTFLPFLIKALSVALSNYPWMNSSFNEELLEVTLKGLSIVSCSAVSRNTVTSASLIPDLRKRVPYNLQVPTILELPWLLQLV